jgi:hypothetical protein
LNERSKHHLSHQGRLCARSPAWRSGHRLAHADLRRLQGLGVRLCLRLGSALRHHLAHQHEHLATTNEIAIAPSSVFTDDIGTLRDTITSIAYKKGASGDALYIVAGFDKE